MIAILTDPGIGGTFLTWSVYYLSGKTEYFSVRQNTVLAVPDSPLTHNNAHNFKANQLGFTDKIDHFISSLIDQHPDECIYMHQNRTFNTQETIDQLCNNTKRIVAVTVAKEQILYFCRYNGRSDKSPAWTSNKMLYDNDDIFNDKLDHFFNKSKEKWHTENLTKVWDTREFIALNFNPFDVPDIGISHYINPQTSAFRLTAMDLWTNFDYSVKELFDYLDLHMYEDRYQKWLLIYNKWKQNHTSGIRFSWYFESIISNILKGIDFDLTRFELDIQQEAAIQHELIYKHNLNLKTWQLTKFTNTKQLHQLLEPNIHDLDKSLVRRLTT